MAPFAPEGVKMGNTDDPEGRRFTLPWLIPVLLPVLYLGSVGPLVGLNERGILPDPIWETLCNSVFAPLAWLESETDVFETSPGIAYMRYIQLFEP